MNIIDFAAQIIFISISGVLSPGPLFFVNLIYGSKQGFSSGVKIASGHTIVELPLVILLGLGLFGFSFFTLTNESIRVIGLVGGIAIIFFSMSQINNTMKRRRIDAGSVSSKNSSSNNYLLKISNKGKRLKGPLILGLTFTA